MTRADLLHRFDDRELAVRARGLRKRYGRTVALDGIDLEVPVGSVFALIGPNGAGKTTTLRILLDLARADEGTAEAFGLDVRSQGPRARAQIGYVPERHDWLPEWMKLGHAMKRAERMNPGWDPDYAARLLDLFELDPGRKPGKMSKGQGRRAQLLLALAGRPPLLILDEPTDGLDPVMRDEVHGILTDHLAETPTTVLVSTHHVHEVASLVDHVAVLARGRLRAQLPTADLSARLLRYTVGVPAGSDAATEMNGAVLHRRSGAGEEIWTVWGEPAEVRTTLAASGIQVRDTARLNLEEAALALLASERRTDR